MSNDMIPITDEQSKALAEVAKASGKAIELLQAFGRFASKALGTVPEDAVDAIIGHKLRLLRLMNFAKYEDMVNENHRKNNVEETEPLSPSIAIPLFDAALDESREELQKLWAALMANALDPKTSKTMRVEFIGTMKRFHPVDVLFLRILIENEGSASHNTRNFLSQQLQMDNDSAQVSMDNLEDCNCIGKIGGQGTNYFVTPYARQLGIACGLKVAN